MGFSSIWHWLIVLLIVLLVFGAKKLPSVAGDLAKSIKNFKAGMKDEGETAAQPATVHKVEAHAADPVIKKDEAART